MNYHKKSLRTEQKTVLTSGLESEIESDDTHILANKFGRPGKRPKIADDKVRKSNLNRENMNKNLFMSSNLKLHTGSGVFITFF